METFHTFVSWDGGQYIMIDRRKHIQEQMLRALQKSSQHRRRAKMCRDAEEERRQTQKTTLNAREFMRKRHQ